MSLNNRSDILTHYGATPSEVEELLAYNENVFAQQEFEDLPGFPLESEPHVATWEAYQEQGKEKGIFATLSSKLPQLQFPIQAGSSELEGYRAAVRKGHRRGCRRQRGWFWRCRNL